MSPDNAADFESAIADIQLFGSPHFVQLAQSVAESIPKSGVAQADQLLLELRKVLRKELGLEEVPGKIISLRITERKISHS